MANLQAGKLRHRVRLDRPTYMQDGTTGDQVLTWVTVATVWAAIEPLSGREFIAAHANQSQVTARITIRRRGDINATWRAVHMVNGGAGTVYNIHAVLADKDSMLEYQNLPVSEGTNDGQ